MQYDRPICISVGNSRKSTEWKTQQYSIESFYDRLRLVGRTEETLKAFLNMPKPRQDTLKDVGGFVGGRMDGNRIVRNIEHRDLICLDLDNVPSGMMDTIATKLDGLGCGYAFYTTRKHQPSAPRVRVVVPTNRPVLVDEYEPIARKLAYLIQRDMSWFDPTTFQVTRLMYWASCSADSEFIFRCADKPLLDADGMLAQYHDWRDVSEWHTVPGTEANIRRDAKKQDPTTREDEIGAFTSTYSISEAIGSFLSGVYEPAGEGRFTFCEGSTSGGAVVYDDTYLYSHHATDPCSGLLVNSFDLVRLHLFGRLDDNVPENTPLNRLPSQKEMLDFVRNDLMCQPLLEDWAAKEYGLTMVGTEMAENTSLHHMMQAGESQNFSEVMVMSMLDAIGISMRYNEITHEIEFSGVESLGIRPSEAENLLAIQLEDYFRAMKAKGASKNAIQDKLTLIASKNRFNPVKDMLVNTGWDGADRIEVLFEVMGISGFECVLVRKWLRQCVAMALNSDSDPWGADGVLVLSGAQGIGKTSLMRRLAVHPSMFKEGAMLAFGDKDTLIGATTRWIVELGEIERTIKSDEASLKAFITSGSDQIRLPYARAAVKQARRASLCGTVNTRRYLRDETGNRRFWTVGCDNIDLNRLWGLTEDWFVQLWAQVYGEWRDLGRDSFRLTGDEQKQLSRINAKRLEENVGEEEIRSLLDPDLPDEKWTEITATQVSHLVGKSLSARAAGRILNYLVDCGDYPGAEKKRSKTLRCYRLPLKEEYAI